MGNIRSTLPSGPVIPPSASRPPYAAGERGPPARRARPPPLAARRLREQADRLWVRARIGVSAHGASKRVSRRSSPSRRGPEGGRADSRDSSVHGHETWAALDMDGSLDFDGRTHAASWQNTTYLPSSPVRQRDWALQSASVALTQNNEGKWHDFLGPNPHQPIL